MKEFPFDPNDNVTLERVRKMPVFDAMDVEQLPQVLKFARIRQYDIDEIIIQEGETDQLVYFLISGNCQVMVDGIDVGNVAKLGDVFGEMGMIDQKPRSATIVALATTLCLVLDGSFLDHLKGVDKLAAQALFYRIFSEILAARIRDANKKLLVLDDELGDLAVKVPNF